MKTIKKITLFMLVAMFTLIAGIVGGCAKSGKSTNLADVNMPVLEDTRGTEMQMNTITTLNGNEVSYNMNTRKIVCIFGSQDVVAFGIKLLAYEASTDIKGYESYYDGATALKDSTPFSAEEVYSYEPELILVNQQMTSEDIGTLSKIAPVIPLYTDSTSFETRLRFIGNVFGLQEHAETLIKYAADLKDTMLANMQELNIQDKTLTMFTYFGAITIPPQRGWFMNVILYDYLGIKRLDIVKEFMEDESGIAYEGISSENLINYEGDLVIYAGFGETTITTFVSENPGWQALKAVREDRVGVIDITPYVQKGVILLYNQYAQILNALKTAAKI